jgi:transposase, IS30 family
MATPGKITTDKREVLENMWRQGHRGCDIARALGVHPSSVSRELRRNGSGRHGVKNPLGRRVRGGYLCGYQAQWADRKARRRRRRPKRRVLAEGTPLRQRVVDLLADKFSPQQIAATLRREYPGRPEMWVSHETIYQSIYLQGRGSLRELVSDAVRTGRQARRSQSRAARAARGAIRGKPWVTEAVHISARPAEVNDRAVPGHWEGDLLIGARMRSAIITLAERSTRFVMASCQSTDPAPR